VAWHRACCVDEVADNRLTKVSVDDIVVLVTRIGDSFIAIPPHCPHLAEPLEMSGVCSEGILTCTKHIWQWDLRTGSELGDAEKPLALYPTKRVGDEVWIDVEREFTYDYDE
jgi:toluene monooxygenase system ferredoxin subunit